jgi:cystathionine beta-lyase/cystathionine gamma-synthase
MTSSNLENTSSWSIATQLVHSGGHDHQYGEESGTPTVPPIFASTTYIHQTAEALEQAFSGTSLEGKPAFVYARQGNPNAHTLESAIAQIEKGVGAVACASGMAAIHIALLAAGLSANTKIVASRDLYGPTITLLRKLFAPIGVEIILTDLCQPAAIDLIRQEQPDVIYAETISNPLAKVVDLDALSSVAHEVGATTIVDSTFSTPYLTRPIEHGFDLVVHSATKYIGGHGDTTGGLVISAKNTLLDQLRSYNMLLGAMLSPFDANTLLRGLRTLALRMERHSDNALKVAHFLQEHSRVAHVYYPGLSSNSSYAVAKRMMAHGHFGGLLAFELQDQTRAAAFRFMNKLHVCLPATTLGDVFSLVSYPPMSSHRTLDATELKNMGITEGCLRLSVGIENADDIIYDLDQALNADE